jgi:hypothetical protein
LFMPPLNIEGYVIVCANGMLADANHVMPPELKFKGDQAFFTAALDRADVIVHGRNSYEDQPNSPKRTRIILTRSIASTASDPSNPKATLWNPLGASFADACAHAGVSGGTAAIIGGPVVFGMFFGRYDTFWLSVAPHVRLSGGEACFPGVPERTPQEVLATHGLKPTDVKILDAAHDVRVTAWRRRRSQ